MVRPAPVAQLTMRACAAGLVLLAAAASAADRHMGVSTCASSVCHGAVTPSKTYDVLLNEYVTWSHSDKHAKAFSALRTQKGREIAARLGIEDPALARECLDCHTDNVPQR
ncbi:MAG: hypothetical protein JOZ93_07755, partial [Sinobacteraceae bacterium]|nr:hypothetical protein [Nevskiaceae bacterium]